MELKDGKTYRSERGSVETVGGTTKHYPAWVWTIQGNWYERATGRAIGYHQTAPRSPENPDGIWDHFIQDPSGRDLTAEVQS